MNLVARIILGIVKLALLAGITGGLTDLTLTMRNEAVKAHKQGLMSLKKLNKSLIGP
jgi:hypothetical protein